MKIEEFKNFAESLSALATFLGIVIGGAWALRKYVFRKEDFPRIEMTVNISFVGMHKNEWIVELLGLLKNKGAVPHAIQDLRFELRCLSAMDGIEDGDKVGGQLFFGTVLKEGSWTPSDSNKPMLILPGVALRYSYVYHVPITARFLILHGKLEYARGGIDHLRADRVFRVPDDAGQVDARNT